MKRAEFLRELEENLKDCIPKEHVEDILYDYAEHFDAGMRDGKSEEEISQELGSPEKIAGALISSDGHLSARKARLLHYAPVGLRLASFIIDTIIAGFPLALFTHAYFLLFLGPTFPHVSLQYPVSAGVPVSALRHLSMLFTVLYQPICLSLWGGQTVGKRLFNLRVVRKDGSHVRAGVAILREILGRTILNTISLGITNLISFAWVILSGKNRTLHDEIAGTYVIVDQR